MRAVITDQIPEAALAGLLRRSGVEVTVGEDLASVLPVQASRKGKSRLGLIVRIPLIL